MINLAAGFVFAVGPVCSSVLFSAINIAERTDGNRTIIIRIFISCILRRYVEFTMVFSVFHILGDPFGFYFIAISTFYMSPFNIKTVFRIFFRTGRGDVCITEGKTFGKIIGKFQRGIVIKIPRKKVVKSIFPGSCRFFPERSVCRWCHRENILLFSGCLFQKSWF